MKLDRRGMIGASGAALVLGLLPARAWAQAMGAQGSGGLPPRPMARVEPVTETRFGVTVVDPYRWMENPADPEWQPFMKGQAAYARAWFDRLPDRAALLKRVSELSGDTPVATNVQRAGDLLFYEFRPAGANVAKLFVRPVAGGEARMLVDPEAMKDASGAHSSLDYWQASPDGRLVAYGTSPSGSENSTIRIVETATGRVFPEAIDRAQYASPSWLPDSSGFFLMRGRADAKLGAPDYYADRVSWLHKVGTDPAQDVRVFARGSVPGVEAVPYDFPFVIVTEGSDVATLALAEGVRRTVKLYVAPLADVVAGRAAWRKVCDHPDEVTGATLRGREMFLISEKGAPMGRVLRLDAAAPDIARATEVLAPGAQALEQVMATRDGVYVQVMDGGNQRFRRLRPGGGADDIAMPFNAGVYGLAYSPRYDGFYARMTGWLSPSAIWFYDPKAGRFADTGLSPKPAVDLSPYEAVSTFAPARDGTRVPVTIVARRGLKRDGSAPCIADAYGSYQISQSPALSLRSLAFLERGGVLATVGVRGGGEYGRPWWEAGKKGNKPNTWRDLIDACEFLVRERWTSTPRLAIEGGSAGGITVGRALTERPDLFGMVISAVGVSNPVRGEVEQNNAPNIPEFGSAKVEGDFPALLAMDSYMAVRDGTRYPAVLLTTGMTDPRVAPWHAAKMAARLQKASASGRPVILRVDFDAGHGLGSTRAQRDEETADMYAAVLALPNV